MAEYQINVVQVLQRNGGFTALLTNVSNQVLEAQVGCQIVLVAARRSRGAFQRHAVQPALAQLPARSRWLNHICAV